MDKNGLCKCHEIEKDLEKRTKHLKSIRDSVRNELLTLEEDLNKKKKHKIALEKALEEFKIHDTKKRINLEKEIELLHLKINQSRDLAEQNTPELKPPLIILPNHKNNFIG